MEDTEKPQQTYIIHFREFPEWLKQSPHVFHLLAEFARRARRETGFCSWNGEVIKLMPRQFLTGRIKTSASLGLTEGEYRTAYDKLVQQRLITTIKTTRRYTIAEFHADAVFGLNILSEQPTDNQQVTTNNNENKENKLASQEFPGKDIGKQVFPELMPIVHDLYELRKQTTEIRDPVSYKKTLYREKASELSGVLTLLRKKIELENFSSDNTVEVTNNKLRLDRIWENIGHYNPLIVKLGQQRIRRENGE